MNNFTAQHGEDRFLLEHWASLGLPEVGYFVEVGACDGLLLSNTYWLEKSKGWKGALIEADPRWRKSIGSNRPNSDYFLCAVSDHDGTESLGMMDEPSLSGFLRESPERIDVSCRTLNTIFSKAGIKRVDLLSIDTEGTELDIWRALDLSRWRPRVVIAEWWTQGLELGNKADEMIRQFGDDGYAVVLKNECNLIFLDQR